ncbi:MAG: hypothetical protein LUD68_07105 [Rikenellaceae bacterium]|nr:hypothetical protein [Rikenellaceae bacterium]
MKRMLFFLLAVLPILYSAQAREVINLNRNWQFSYTSDLRSRSTVDLPHTWNYDVMSIRLQYNRGLSNYIKEVDIPQEWSEKRIFIRFYGINNAANLFVNGQYVGEHKGGYTAVTYEITTFLKSGASNNIWVRVNNSPQLDFMPINSDFNIYGGIYRDVELIVVDQAHFALNDFSSDGIYLR